MSHSVSVDRGYVDIDNYDITAYMPATNPNAMQGLRITDVCTAMNLTDYINKGTQSVLQSIVKTGFKLKSIQ